MRFPTMNGGERSDTIRHRKVWLGNTSSFIINLAQTATLIPVTFYLQSEIGFSASATGALLMLQPLVMGIVAPFAGWFRDRYGRKFSDPCRSGVMFRIHVIRHVLADGSGMEHWSPFSRFRHWYGLFHATNNAEVMSAAPAEKSSLAGSLLALVRYLGQIVGIGLATVFVGTMGSLAQIHESHGVSIRILFGICCALCLAVAIAGRYLPKEKPNSPNLSAS
ncbi:hypothetical protein VQ056_14595 [Paenibacillus sp. JTLBN-2024]